MRNGASRLTANGWRGIWRASIPAIAGAACVGSLRRQSRPRLAKLRGRQWKLPASLMSWLLSLVLVAQAGALPVHLGLLSLGGNAHAMTEGCKKRSCCTALCYLDRYGIHHCVHEPGDSCECGISNNDWSANPLMLSTVVTAPDAGHLFPNLIPTGWVFPMPSFSNDHYPATPSPPPK